MLKAYSFKTKLLLLCAFMAFISIVISAIAYTGLHNVDESNRRIVDRAFPETNNINSMMIHFNKVRVELRTLGLPGLSKVEAEKSIQQVGTEITAFEEDVKEYQRVPFIQGQKEIFDNLMKEWSAFKIIGSKVITLYKSGTQEDIAKMQAIFFKDCPEAAQTFTIAIESALKFHREHLTLVDQESKSIQQKANVMIIAISIAGILLSLTVGYFFATITAKSMNDIVNSLSGSAENVSAAATQIASASEQLSQASTEQAASLQETSSSIEEINSMISSNSENAKQSERSAALSLMNAEKGKETVEKMIKAIEHINASNEQIMTQIDQSNKEMEDIVKVINEIGTKTKVINDIVFQTKLLSFNASVEAARAGEAGKGFAVVAEEVGNLAAMSGNAAVEISKMLDSSVEKVQVIVKSSKEKMSKLIAEGKESVDSGNRIASECGEVLNEIVNSVATVTKSVEEISIASQEQSQGVLEITKAISQLDQVTQENSAGAAESANAAENLSEQAARLKDLVKNLVFTMEGERNRLQESHHSGAVVIPLKKENREFKKMIRPSANDLRFKDV